MSKAVFELIPSFYPFVRNFRDFLSRIHQQTVYQGYPENKRSLASFKLLIPEESIRKSILANAQVRQTFRMKISDKLYKKWDALFRMIVNPKLFEVLQNSHNRSQIMATIAKDFLDQFKHPALQEESMARVGENAIQLYCPRSYFLTQQEDVRLKRELDISVDQNAFLEEWKSLYLEDFQPVYRKNPIIEARETIDWLINKNKLPNYEFDLMPTYTEYWNFVKNQRSVDMVTISGTSGLQKSFKGWVLNEGWDLEKILQEDVKRTLLEQNQRARTLIEAYIPFSKLENDLSNIGTRLVIHYRRLNSLEKRKRDLESPKEWELTLLDVRINEARKGIKLALDEIGEIKLKILEADFFKMFELFASYQHFIENGNWMNPSELTEHAFLQLLSDEAKDYLVRPDLIRDFF